MFKQIIGFALVTAITFGPSATPARTAPVSAMNPATALRN